MILPWVRNCTTQSASNWTSLSRFFPNNVSVLFFGYIFLDTFKIVGGNRSSFNDTQYMDMYDIHHCSHSPSTHIQTHWTERSFHYNKIDLSFPFARLSLVHVRSCPPPNNWTFVNDGNGGTDSTAYFGLKPVSDDHVWTCYTNRMNGEWKNQNQM